MQQLLMAAANLLEERPTITFNGHAAPAELTWGKKKGLAPEIASATRLMDWALAQGVKADVAMYNTLIKGHAACSPPQPEEGEFV